MIINNFFRTLSCLVTLSLDYLLGSFENEFDLLKFYDLINKRQHSLKAYYLFSFMENFARLQYLLGKLVLEETLKSPETVHIFEKKTVRHEDI